MINKSREISSCSLAKKLWSLFAIQESMLGKKIPKTRQKYVKLPTNKQKLSWRPFLIATVKCMFSLLASLCYVLSLTDTIKVILAIFRAFNGEGISQVLLRALFQTWAGTWVEPPMFRMVFIVTDGTVMINEVYNLVKIWNDETLKY